MQLRLIFLSLFLFLAGGLSAALTIPAAEPEPYPRKMISVVQHLGRQHFKIKTRTATYLYDPVAGGFSSILDRNGKDWVAYQDDEDPQYPAAAATKYRGLPNLVFGGDDDGAGHPGFAKCESRVVGRNQIHTVSLSGKWAWKWTFYKDAARLDVFLVPDDRKYWFLYEGPVGGTYAPRSSYWASDLTDVQYTIPDHYQEKVTRDQFRYLYFGEQNNPYVFFMAQATPDTRPDHLSYLGNEEIGAADSPDGMVVAGFGRAAGATPLLTGNNTFVIGFLPKDPVVLTKRRVPTKIEKLVLRRGRDKKAGRILMPKE